MQAALDFAFNALSTVTRLGKELVMAGDPAMRSAHKRIAGWNATVAFNRISPRDADKYPLRLEAFSAEDKKLFQAAVAKQCDALPIQPQDFGGAREDISPQRGNSYFLRTSQTLNLFQR